MSEILEKLEEIFVDELDKDLAEAMSRWEEMVDEGVVIERPNPFEGIDALLQDLSTIERHGKHSGQKGVKGQRGGSQAGFTHDGGGKGESKKEFETGSESGEAGLRSRDFVGSGLSRKQIQFLTRAGTDSEHMEIEQVKQRLEDFGISVPDEALQIAYWRALEEKGKFQEENQASMREVTHQLLFMGAEKPDTIDDSTYLDFGPVGKDPRLITSLKAAEERFLDSPIIQMAAFDESGNEIYSDKGKVSSITIPNPSEVDLRGSYIIHNHPAGNSLTKEDISAGFEHGVKEIYASGGNRRYIASYSDTIQDMPQLLREMGAEDIWQRAAAISQQLRSDQQNDVDRGRTFWWQAESQHNDLVNKAMVENRSRAKFTYHIEEIEESEQFFRIPRRPGD